MNTKCVVWLDKEKIAIQERAIPAPGPSEILLRVMACSICGSDIRTFYNGHSRVHSGAIIGHEVSGEVVQVGSHVTGFRVGDPVAIGADVPCGHCKYCLQGQPNCCESNHAIGHQLEGGFTEYMLVSQMVLDGNGVVPFQHVRYAEAALAEPLACCINGYERGLYQARPVRSVAIIGAGSMGALLAMLGKFLGIPAVLMVDVSAKRLQRVQDMGIADQTFLAQEGDRFIQEVRDWTQGSGVDLAFTACSDASTHPKGLRLLDKRGVLNLFGGVPNSASQVPMDANLIHYKELYVTGSHGSTPTQFQQALEYIDQGQIDVSRIITHRFPLDQIHQAYQTAQSEDAMKVVIEPNAHV